MIRVDPVEAWHFRQIDVQPEQEEELMTIRGLMLTVMQYVGENREYNGAIMDGDEILALSGIHNLGTHGEAWTFLANGIERRMVAVTRTVVRYMRKFSLTSLPIYANINPHHPEAVRWASLLGYRPTGKADIWCYISSAD